MSIGARVFSVPWLVVVGIHIFFSAAGAAERCREPADRLVSVQGDAQVREQRAVDLGSCSEGRQSLPRRHAEGQRGRAGRGCPGQ